MKVGRCQFHSLWVFYLVRDINTLKHVVNLSPPCLCFTMLRGNNQSPDSARTYICEVWAIHKHWAVPINSQGPWQIRLSTSRTSWTPEKYYLMKTLVPNLPKKASEAQVWRMKWGFPLWDRLKFAFSSLLCTAACTAYGVSPALLSLLEGGPVTTQLTIKRKGKSLWMVIESL